MSAVRPARDNPVMGRPATTVDEAFAAGWYRPNEHGGLCHCRCGAVAPLAKRSDPRNGYVHGQPKRFVHGHRVRVGSPSLSASVRAKISAAQRGSRSWRWKGDDIGYSALHKWLTANFPKVGVCENCSRTCKTDWANVSGEYRRDRSDFIELCRSCHRNFDKAGS